MAVGREVFETVFWTGRFFEAATRRGADVSWLPRKAIKVHLCGSARAQDSNIRVALIDRFGGSERAKGTKKAPGALFGIKAHEWAALALAVTWWDQAGAVTSPVTACRESLGGHQERRRREGVAVEGTGNSAKDTCSNG
jgi:hypothetical protein